MVCHKNHPLITARGNAYKIPVLLALANMTLLSQGLVKNIRRNTAKTTAVKQITYMFSYLFSGNLDKIAKDVIPSNNLSTKFSLVIRQNPPMYDISGSFEAELKTSINDKDIKKATHKTYGTKSYNKSEFLYIKCNEKAMADINNEIIFVLRLLLNK